MVLRSWQRPHVPAAVATALVLGACDLTAPVIPESLAPIANADRTAGDGGELAPLAAAHKANPSDSAAALAYAKALRGKGAIAEALAILEAAARAKPRDRRLALERGLTALELGDAAKAEAVLRSAHDPKAADWRLHSALGAALASRGKHPEAQVQFAKALALAPDHPSVLNNLALSYALDGNTGEAERLLRRAQQGTKGGREASKVQQNLALVLGLGGKYAEARTAAEAALPVAKAGENVTYLQKLAEARTAAEPADKAAAANLPLPTYQLGWSTVTRR